MMSEEIKLSGDAMNYKFQIKAASTLEFSVGILSFCVSSNSFQSRGVWLEKAFLTPHKQSKGEGMRRKAAGWEEWKHHRSEKGILTHTPWTALPRWTRARQCWSGATKHTHTQKVTGQSSTQRKKSEVLNTQRNSKPGLVQNFHSVAVLDSRKSQLCKKLPSYKHICRA